MRLVLAPCLVVFALAACAADPAADLAATGDAVTRATLRPLDFCGNGIDEDGDGVDRVCQAATTTPVGPSSVAVLRGWAEGAESSYDVEIRLVPDGDPACPNPPVAWPSVEACVGSASCTIQLRADVRISDPGTGAVLTTYSLMPRRCSGGSLGSTTFSWNAQQNSVNIAATAFGGGGQRLTLRSTESGTLFGSGTAVGGVAAMDLYVAGVE